MAQSSPLGRSYHLKLKEVRKKAVTLLIFFFFHISRRLEVEEHFAHLQQGLLPRSLEFQLSFRETRGNGS